MAFKSSEELEQAARMIRKESNCEVTIRDSYLSVQVPGITYENGKQVIFYAEETITSMRLARALIMSMQ